jgi:hypothetical protein
MNSNDDVRVRSNLQYGKILSKIRDQVFPAFLHLRMVVVSFLYWDANVKDSHIGCAMRDAAQNCGCLSGNIGSTRLHDF